MKKVNVLMAGGVLILGLTNPVYSQEENFEKVGTKIGIIDATTIFEEHPDYKKANDVYFKEVKEKQEEINARTKEIRKLEDELKSNLLLSDEERAKKETQINEKKQAVLKYSQEAEEYLTQREEELKKQITQSVIQIIKKTAQEQDIDIVLESNYVLYADDTLDITDEVIAKIKAMSPSQGKESKNKQ